MTDFKVGDRVTYTGNVSAKMTGKVGVVVQSPYPGISLVFFDHGGDELYGAYPESLTKLPAPDVITINRADLPEVRERDGKFWAGSGPEECVANGHENPNWLRNHAHAALALAEFLETREKSAREATAAEHKRNKRRNELAELFSGIPSTRYGLRNRDLRNAIDHIIELEDKTHD